MKKVLFLAMLIILYVSAKSQTIVQTAPMLKNVLLEEYTGIHCGYCPDGHKKAEAISDENPGRVVLINIHQGTFANPGTGEPDFRTIFGDSLAAQAKVTGYPNGTINRHVFADLGANTALSRNMWANASSRILMEASPLNVGFTSTFDSATRILTINVEVYYVQNSPQPLNFLNIALLENHVIGYQSDYANGNHTDYDHKHILRYLITGQWGDKITTTTKGSLFSKVYQYTVPSNFVIENCDIAVFVAESHQEIYTGVMDKANGGYHDGVTKPYVGDLKPLDAIAYKGAPSQKTSFDFEALSVLPGTNDYYFWLEKKCPPTWSVSFKIDTFTYTDEGYASLTSDSAKSVILEVIPDTTPDFAEFILHMEVLNDSGAMKNLEKAFVVSGVSDLIVNNSSAWGDGSDTSAALFENNFLEGLKSAGNRSHASVESDILILAEKSNVLEGINNIYYNVGWSFPSLTDDLVHVFSAFLNNGGNLMISGQDIGWDNFHESGYGTDITKAFCSDYLHAGFVADGGAANNQLTVKSGDGVYSSIGASAIVNVYGTDDSGTPYFYPDELTAEANGQAVFNYNSGIKIAAVRSRVEAYKTFFLGVSLEMIASETVRTDLMKHTYNWFTGVYSEQEFDEKLAAVFAYPNPAKDKICILLPKNTYGMVRLIDMKGVSVGEWKFYSNENQLYIPTATFDQGIYILQITDNLNLNTQLIEIIK